jgi:demethylmenaquinone methyltransferase / 2-methoxy-6-polyprenyl-1,4-benzoquinol methylase
VRAHSGTLPPEGVRQMFDRIAPVYDPMNRLMSAGLDRRWRQLAAEAVVRPGDRVLDVCCGSGDLAIAAREVGGEVTGIDFSERMLERARRKEPSITWTEADALALPFVEGSFDAVTIGFGLRNLADAAEGLAELRRVLRDGGRVAVLDLSRPRGVLGAVCRVWLERVVPQLGRVLPGGWAYSYLPASARRFPAPEELARLMDGVGFDRIRWRLFAGGLVALHNGAAR